MNKRRIMKGIKGIQISHQQVDLYSSSSFDLDYL